MLDKTDRYFLLGLILFHKNQEFDFFFQIQEKVSGLEEHSTFTQEKTV